MVNSNIGPNSTPLRDKVLKSECDLDFDLLRPLKVRSDGAICLPTYGFLLMFNSNIRPNQRGSYDKRRNSLTTYM